MRLFQYNPNSTGHKRLIRIVAFLAVGLALLLISSSSGSVFADAPVGGHIVSTYAACPAWTQPTTPNQQGAGNVLEGVSAISANDAWAVGYTDDGHDLHPLAMRWDGHSWTLVASPNPGEGTSYFNAVAALSDNDVWALLSYVPDQTAVPMIEHWDGQSWTSATLPALDPSGNELYSISAASPTDILAVGGVGCNKCKTERSLALHYNGVDWQAIPVVSGTYADALFGVTALSATDGWAVGFKYTDAGPLPFALHWDGKGFQDMPIPTIGGNSSYLNSITAISPTDLWAVGYRENYEKSALLVLHSDGKGWAEVDAPNPSEEGTNLFGVDGKDPNNIWAVGYFIASARRHALLYHYDGTAWSQDTSTDAGVSADLFGVTALANGGALAVGYNSPSGVTSTLVEQYSDPCAAPPPTDTPLPLPATSTPALPPTPTNTSTPVATVQIPGTNSQMFPETRQSVSGIFLDYWNGNGGLSQQGYPISGVIGEVSPLDGKPYTVQYFERAVFEYHPENQVPYNVLLSQLGTFRYKEKYPNGAPGQVPNISNGSVEFAETGKRLGGKFLEYWNTHGGVAQQGYPISDEFQEKSDLDGQVYTVQYFERAEFESHPENQAPYDVLLSQLGTFHYKEQYPGAK